MYSRSSFQIRLLALCLLLLFGSTLSQAKENKAPGPKISVDTDKHDFGKVEEGVELKHVFKVSNIGSTVLQLWHVTSTCGCTIPKLNKQRLQPGESTELSVIVDTTMKQGKITKKVALTCDDPVDNVIYFYLSMNVQNPHIGMSEEARAKIFTSDKCSSCHVAKGVGAYGKDLYAADCAMCHGKRAQGAVGPCLIGPYEYALYKDNITQITSCGSKTHRSMPGFLASAGGPLSKAQIDSIVKYLAELSKQNPAQRALNN